VGELAALLHVHRQDPHDLVAVDLDAGGVHRKAAVGIPVVGDPEVRTVGDDSGLERAEVGRAVAVVDVQPVGGGADLDDLGTRQAEDPGETMLAAPWAPSMTT
jgi:hypothetical protein